MKKTFKYIMLVAVGIVGMLQLSSCKDDANDWTVDTSVTKQRPPSSLKAEVDSASLDMTVTISCPGNCKSIELQVSDSPLTSNDDIEVTGELYSFSSTDNPGGMNSYTFTVSRSNDQFVVQQNTTYYFRARCIGTDGTISNWYTNGMLYYGGVSDQELEQRLITNTYSYVETPATAWIDDASVGETSLTIHWIVTDYAKATTLKNEVTGEEIDITNAPKDPAYSKVKVQYYDATGLESGMSYTFTVLDENGNVLGTATKATEEAPNMNWAYFIGEFPTIATSTAEVTVNGKNAAGVEDSRVSLKILNGGKLKTESKNNTDNPFYNPLNKEFYPLTPDIAYPGTKTAGNRITTGGKAGSMELTVPAEGRLYLYIASGSGKVTITQGETETVLTPPTSIVKTPATAFTKAYIEAGTATITWTASTYFCGIHYVPWAEVK